MTAPLHPRGTLRHRFEPVASDFFRKLGVGARSCDLGDEGLYLAEELVAADAGWLGSGEHPEALAVLVLALMIAQRQGSTRLPLDPRGPLRTLVADVSRLAGAELDIPRVLKTIANLTRAPRFNSVIGVGGARLPLVVDGDALYTERARWLEHRVAARLAERIAMPARSGIEGIAARVAASSARALNDEQRRAVEIALANRISVVTGGPGTGKTLVAAAIVRGFAAMEIPHIALAAQTGKAANRLTEVIAEQGVAVDPAQTLHRLLGYRAGSRSFSHHAQSPLPVGAVIVDEASMIDLELVDALLDALPAEAPLVLIGDAHQLPAIDAGQVLTDLTIDQIAAPVVARLAKSYRQDTSDPDGLAVYEAARAIHDGEPARLFEGRRSRDSSRSIDRPIDAKRSTPGIDPEQRIPGEAADPRPKPASATRALATPRLASKLVFRGVEWVDTSGSPRPHDVTLAVADALWLHLEGPRALRAAERVFRFVDGTVLDDDRAPLEALWQLLARGRVLTVTRTLPTGSVAINQHLHQLGLDRLSVTGRPEFIPGEPVMVTANDYQRGLFNGDQGIIVRAEVAGRAAGHRYMAVFRQGGELRPFAIEALRDRLELAWALTIHKSQGSELDAVALLLPHEDIPLVTRELLYTGITRARKCAVLAGAKPILVNGAKRVAQRHSGLGERLRATLVR